MSNSLKLIRNRFLLVLLVLVLAFVFFILGLMLGYALIGDGNNPLAILSLKKWADLIAVFQGK